MGKEKKSGLNRDSTRRKSHQKELSMFSEGKDFCNCERRNTILIGNSENNIRALMN